MFDIFWELSFINALSFAAFLTTVGLFICGVPICKQIWKRQDTNEISGMPFLMGVLGGCCWLSYGTLKNDPTVKSVTTVQCILYGIYCCFYWYMSKKKFWISVRLVALALTCAALILSVHLWHEKVLHPLGVVCLALNIADFAAPLAGLRVVIRRRATSTLPLPLCIANFMVSSEWCLYGVLRHDFYLIFPNGVGSFLAGAQLILFLVLPRKPGQAMPIVRLYRAIVRCSAEMENDLEKAAVVPVEKRASDERSSNHRWSKRVMANVTGEFGNVVNKVTHLGPDQFAYSAKLNDAEDTVTLDSRGSNGSTPPAIDADKPVQFPLVVTNEAQLLALSRRLIEGLKAEAGGPSAPTLAAAAGAAIAAAAPAVTSTEPRALDAVVVVDVPRASATDTGSTATKTTTLAADAPSASATDDATFKASRWKSLPSLHKQ